MKLCPCCNRVALSRGRLKKGICVTCEVAPPESLKAVYQFIKAYIGWHSLAPTPKEISQRMGLTLLEVGYHLIEMKRLGWIARDGHRWRVIIPRLIR